MQFTKRVKRTILMGIITVPKKYDGIFENSEYCAIGNSVDITYDLKSSTRLDGRLYHSTNNTTTYYQFYIIASRDKEIFRNEIEKEREISLHFELSTKTLHVAVVKQA